MQIPLGMRITPRPILRGRLCLQQPGGSSSLGAVLVERPPIALKMNATVPDVEAAVASEVNATEAARQIKDKEHERVQTKAKAAEAEAENARLEAGGGGGAPPPAFAWIAATVASAAAKAS